MFVLKGKVAAPRGLCETELGQDFVDRRLRQTTISVGMTGAGRVDWAGCLRVDGRGRAAGALRFGRHASKREGRRRAEGKSELAQARRRQLEPKVITDNSITINTIRI